jgi:hypothetical protein
VLQTVDLPEPHYALTAYAAMADAYRAKDAARFDKAVSDYRGKLEAAGIHAADLKKGPREQLLNFIEPFYRGMVISVLAFLLSIFVWFAPERFEWARKSAVWLMVLALVVMSAGLVARMVLEGRPPVTNLYSSALFIGWAAAALGLVLEVIWPRAIGVAVSSMLGFGTLMIAHFLSLDGDTMIMLRAVLDARGDCALGLCGDICGGDHRDDLCDSRVLHAARHEGDGEGVFEHGVCDRVFRGAVQFCGDGARGDLG